MEIFKNFDFSDFWIDSDYAIESYVGKTPTDELIYSVEEELGYKLPASYVALMKLHNGGIPKNTCFPCEENTSWAADHIAITGIMGIGREKTYSICGSLGSQFMIDEWEYPNIGICVCDCPSAGHDMIMLDYSKCGKDGEPEVVHVDQESNFHITFLAKNFEVFIRGLVNEDVFDTSQEDLKNDLKNLENGRFSTVLTQLFACTPSTDFDKILRNLLTKLTTEKGYFGLHDDELSHLTYDILFYLFSMNNKVSSTEQYLKEYPTMIAFGDKEISTGGYAAGFVSEWLNQRLTNKEILKKLFKGYKLSLDYEKKLFIELKKYE